MAAAPRRRAARGHEPWVLTRSFTARSAGAPVVSPIHYNQMRITVICVVRNEITATYAVSFIMLHGLPPRRGCKSAAPHGVAAGARVVNCLSWRPMRWLEAHAAVSEGAAA